MTRTLGALNKGPSKPRKPKTMRGGAIKIFHELLNTWEEANTEHNYRQVLNALTFTRDLQPYVESPKAAMAQPPAQKLTNP